MAMAEERCGVRYISGERSGWPRCSCRGKRRNKQKRERGEQRQAVGGFDGLDVEHALQRSENEGAGDQSRDEGIENDEDAPLEFDLVRIHEAFDRDVATSLLSVPRFTSSHRPIHAVVEDLCARRHVRFQDLHAMGLQEFVNRILGILQICQLARAGGADSRSRPWSIPW